MVAPSLVVDAHEHRLLAAVAEYLDAADAGRAHDAAAFVGPYPGELLEFIAVDEAVARITAPLRQAARSARRGENWEGGG